ncbi:serine/threonine-protein kinase [Frigoriglobus tundricola]|uniref:Serine/threonine protein kinase n=1 Tax=Frigoriglobus tundricola TaxID=2774151 RepID=A0A6M5YST0_9BACT|nr:serine/threonine-protein kinase [Frigoriglobus tundricola]QJW96351.1 Serine/threonine protein kinase [Frigoriglobus tundricola]
MPDDLPVTRLPAPDTDPELTRVRSGAASTDAVAGLSTDHPLYRSPPQLPAVPGYRVTHEIARGGMGCVLAARDLVLDRDVAIKVLLPGGDTADAARRFVTESKVTAQLPHPNVPPVYALGTLGDGSPFLVMKLVAGRTLAALLEQRGAPGDDLSRFVQAFEQVCLAVGFAHSQGVVHRDLKPANIMVGAFGEVQVMDWGLARLLNEGPTPPRAPRPRATRPRATRPRAAPA